MPRRPSSVFAHGRSEGRERPAVVAAAQRARKRLGHRLLELRETRGWTQAEAAEAAGLHPVHVSRLEAGSSNVTIVTLVALALAFNVPLHELFAPRPR